LNSFHTLSLFNFRLFKAKEFAFGPRVTCIIGPNARGKTTILEAIFFLLTGKSFRTSKPFQLLKHGESAFKLSSTFEKYKVLQKLSMSYEEGQRKIHHNGTVYSSHARLLGIVPVVVLTPNDVALIRGEPLYRRAFLDLHLSLSDPLYLYYLLRYTKALRQRNVLVRANQPKEMSIWEEEMGKAAAYISQSRLHFLEDLRKPLEEYYQKLTDRSDSLQATLNLKEKMPSFDYYKALWKETRSRDIKWGYTSVGPHKDDFSLCLSDKEAKLYASEGEQRLLASVLKCAEVQRMKKQLEVDPLLLIDDFGVGLDDERKNRFIHTLQEFPQVILSSTHQTFPSQFATIKL